MRDAASTATVAASAAAAAAAVGLLAYSVNRRRKQQQQQLQPIPSVGHYPVVGSHYHLQEPWYLDLYERFGQHPLVCVHFGLCPVKVFQDWQLFKEAMVDRGESLAGRMNQRGVAQIFGDYGGIASTDGELWCEYRRFTLKVLRDFGLGRKGGEELISVEADFMCRHIRDAKSSVIDTEHMMSKYVSNVICQFVFGSRLASEDPNFDKFLEIFRGITQRQDSNIDNSVMLSTAPITGWVPQLVHLLTLIPGATGGFQNFRFLLDYCRQQRDKRAAEMHNLHTATNYIEAHLLHQKENPEIFNDTRLALAVTELFIAGTDTTGHTLCWAILYMIRHPDIADKVHEEITSFIGTERLPMMKDKVQLHYTQAVLEEVLRCSSLVAMGVFHRVTSDVRVGPYQLYKNDMCLFNTYAMHHDSRVFPNPKQFSPERHLSDGKFVPCERLCTFGLGRRACLGESLARMELFIFFTSLMQRYRFSLDPEDSRTVWQLTEDRAFLQNGILRTPPEHRILFSSR